MFVRRVSPEKISYIIGRTITAAPISFNARVQRLRKVDKCTCSKACSKQTNKIASIVLSNCNTDHAQVKTGGARSGPTPRPVGGARSGPSPLEKSVGRPMLDQHWMLTGYICDIQVNQHQ